MTEKLKRTAASPFLDMGFKLVVVIIIPWSIWVTNAVFSCIHFQSSGARFSAQDGHRLEKIILEEGVKHRQLMYDFEREFSSNFVRHTELRDILRDKK